MTEPPPIEVPRPRPLAVTASALLVAFGGAGALVMAASLLATSAGVDDLVPGGRIVARAMATVLALSAVAAVATAVGLWRLRHWSRIAILVIAGSVVAFCAASMLVVLALPMRDLLGPDAGRAQAVRSVMLTVYAIPGAVGVWWLVQFTRASMKGLFAADGPIEPARVPLTVGLIGWATLVAGAVCLVLPLLDVPAFLGGAVLEGWVAGLFYLGLATVQLYIGRGLLRLDERARQVGVAFFALATLYGLAGVLLPGMRDAALAYGRGFATRFDAPFLFEFDGVWWWISGVVIAGFAIPAWLLVRWRHAFGSVPRGRETHPS